MNSISTSWFVVTAILVIVAVVVIALLAQTAWLFLHNRRQLAALQHRPGAEYDRTVDDLEGQSDFQSEQK
jgi:NADH:ubiquinone oxidoreductase subunit H